METILAQIRCDNILRNLKLRSTTFVHNSSRSEQFYVEVPSFRENLTKYVLICADDLDYKPIPEELPGQYPLGGLIGRAPLPNISYNWGSFA